MLKARHDTVVSLPEAQLRVGRWHMCAAALTTFARKQPLGVLGGIILLMMIIVALLASSLAPFDPYANSVRLNFCMAVELSNASGQYA